MKRSRSRRGRAKEYSFGALALALLLFFLYEVYPALTQPAEQRSRPARSRSTLSMSVRATAS